jgi:hypothetical protein
MLAITYPEVFLLLCFVLLVILAVQMTEIRLRVNWGLYLALRRSLFIFSKKRFSEKASFVLQHRYIHPHNHIPKPVICPSHPLWMGPISGSIG